MRFAIPHWASADPGDVRSLDLDHRLATALALGGGISLAAAFIVTRHPFDMPPSMDGVFVCGVLGFVLAMLHGLPFRRALLVMAPIVVIQLAAFASYRVVPFGAFGMQAVIYGLVGLGKTHWLRVAARLHPPPA